MSERLNFVIFGATGFTGKHTAAKLHDMMKNDKNFTWGIAGRSQSKLQQILKDIEKKTGDDLSYVKIIISDISDIDSIRQMTKQATVILNCCGPYRDYGEPVVKSCIETNTHYVDVSGEASFLEKMALDYNEAAKKAGVYIVCGCGYDSIPSDMGVVFLQQNFKGHMNSAETYLENDLPLKHYKLFGGVINYGTWESLVNSLAEHEKEVIPIRRQLFAEEIPQQYPKLKQNLLFHKSDVINNWCLPLPGPDPSVVYRSQRFFYENDKKRPAQMHGYIGFPSFLLALFVAFFFVFVAIMIKFDFTRKLLLKYPGIFTLGFITKKGPSDDVMNNMTFTVTIVGKGWDENATDFDGKPTTKTMKVKVAGRNPAYGATCVALICSGLAIFKDGDKMPGKGGVLPPGAAFANTSIIEMLNKNGLTFEVMN